MEKWSENVIVADADYVDSVAFNLTVNFERMLGRRIPKADLAQWLVCVALDGGLRPPVSGDTPEAPENGAGADSPDSPDSPENPGNPENAAATPRVSVVLTHRKAQMENFAPGDFEHDINGQAFADALGEFALTACKVEPLVGSDQLFLDIVDVVCTQPGVRRLMLIPNAESPDMLRQLRERLAHHTRRKPAAGGSFHQDVTLFTMQPVSGPFQQEILGYSLMAALGIKGEEITNSIK